MPTVLPKTSSIVSEALSIEGRGRGLFDLMCTNDLEGVVAKRLADPYDPRVRWLKIKNRDYSQKEGKGICSMGRGRGRGRASDETLPRAAMTLDRAVAAHFYVHGSDGRIAAISGTNPAEMAADTAPRQRCWSTRSAFVPLAITGIISSFSRGVAEPTNLFEILLRPVGIG